MSLLAQEIIVTLLALGAAVIILRRLVGAFRPAKSGPACPNCASGAAACAKVPDAPMDRPAEAVPLTLHRRRL
jgi:hypothetical protein